MQTQMKPAPVNLYNINQFMADVLTTGKDSMYSAREEARKAQAAREAAARKSQ